jgi:hypothetical protein
MGRNAQRAKEPMSVGKSLGSGFRPSGGLDTRSPASGVRSANELAKVTPRVVGFPPARAPHDSEAGLTQIGPPPPQLLALARREPEREVRAPSRGRPVLWFLLGLLVGASGVWGAKSDVRADVYRARAWVASSLRAARGHGKEQPASAGATVQVTAGAIPTVDVTELPHAREERPPNAARSIVAPASVVSPPAPGAPAWRHAPGPK